MNSASRSRGRNKCSEGKGTVRRRCPRPGTLADLGMHIRAPHQYPALSPTPGSQGLWSSGRCAGHLPLRASSSSFAHVTFGLEPTLLTLAWPLEQSASSTVSRGWGRSEHPELEFDSGARSLGEEPAHPGTLVFVIAGLPCRHPWISKISREIRLLPGGGPATAASHAGLGPSLSLP